MSNRGLPSAHSALEQKLDFSQQWLLLRTQPRREAQVDRYLQEKGVETYLPLKSVGISQGMPIREPFFPTYLFFRFQPGNVQLPLVRWAPGSRQVVSIGDEPTTVPASLVEAIRDRLTRPEPGIGSEIFRRGDRVKVVSGSLAGWEAVFDETISGTRRALILIEFLGRQVRAQVPIEQLRGGP